MLLLDGETHTGGKNKKKKGAQTPKGSKQLVAFSSDKL